MSRPGPSSVAVAAGALLGMSVATFTPGLLFIAGCIDFLHQQSIALAFHVVLAAWGALTGVLVVRERFNGESRKSLALLPVYAGVYFLTGFTYTLVVAARAGGEAYAALIMIGSGSLALTAGSLLVAAATWLLVRRLATGFVADSARSESAEAEIAKRAARWLLAAAALQVATGVVGGPVLFGALAAGGSAWLFLRSRPQPRAVLGVVAACLVVLAGAAGQATLWAAQSHELQRAALPPCADGESDRLIPGAYHKRARAVPGVADVIALLRLDKSKFPSAVYNVVVTVVPTPGAVALDVRHAVERALAAVDCDEGTQLRRVPIVVAAPVERAIDVEAIVRLRPGATTDSVRPELESKLRAALARTRLSATGPALSLPSASDLSGVEQVTWRVDGSPHAEGEALSYTGDVELPVLGRLVLRGAT
ncbi:MAG TPA: hypothetical protein VGF76_13250 [Polyangiaceae bacterium]